MIKILYVHGYKGHANGESSKLISKCLNDMGVECQIDAPSIPILEPDKVKKFLFDNGNNYDIIVASSMGAFYGMQQFGAFKVLVNPALPDTLRGLEGENFEQEFLATIDKQKEDFFNKFKDFESMEETYFVFGDKDTVAKNKEFFTNNYRSSQIYTVEDMEHQMDECGAKKIADIIKNEIMGKIE